MKPSRLLTSVIAVALVLAMPQLAVSQQGVVISPQNPLQLALKRWYAVNSATTVTEGTDPAGLAFDGANVWVTNFVDATVTNIRSNDATVLGTFTVGHKPYNIAFDGANIWVTNQGDNNVVKLRASDGTTL